MVGFRCILPRIHSRCNGTWSRWNLSDDNRSINRSELTIIASYIFLLLTFLQNICTMEAHRERTTRPMVTGTSVIGVVYDEGVLLAADTQLSFGSMSKSQRAQRLTAIDNSRIIVGGSGDYSDYQKVMELLQAKALEETSTSLMDSLYADTSDAMSAETTWNYLRHIMYNKRNKMDPYWNDLVVAGMDQKGEPFLGWVDKIGTTVKDKYIATGFGAYLALPLLREHWRPDMSEGDARALLEDCLTVCFYRDCRASARVQLGKVAKNAAEPVLISDPYTLETDWSSVAFQQTRAGLETDGGW